MESGKFSDQSANWRLSGECGVRIVDVHLAKPPKSLTQLGEYLGEAAIFWGICGKNVRFPNSRRNVYHYQNQRRTFGEHGEHLAKEENVCGKFWGRFQAFHKFGICQCRQIVTSPLRFSLIFWSWNCSRNDEKNIFIWKMVISQI